MLKKSHLLILMAGVTALAVGCTPSPGALKKAIEDNPDIVFSAIEKNPDKFMAVVQKAAETAREKGAANAEKEEKERVEKEMANPLKPEITDTMAARGPKDAPVTIVEYSDFQCPFCQRGFNTMKEVMEKYDGKVRFIFKDLPLPMHPLAMPAAKRFEALNMQSPEKAFKYHDQVFTNQNKLNEGGEKYLDSVAKSVGADMAKLKKDMASDEVATRIKASMDEAHKFGIEGTPGFIISGVSVRGAYPFPTFQEIIDKKLAAAK